MKFKKNYLAYILLFISLWVLLLWCSPYSIIELADYAAFSFLGVLGAIFANATGAGGGVIFIPFFSQLEFTEQQSIATSFAIQCFGMTAGAVTWYHYYHTQKKVLHLWLGFKRIIGVTSVAAIISIISVLHLEYHSPAALHLSFSWFSLLLGGFIILTLWRINPYIKRNQICFLDYSAIFLIGLFGGAITSWLSVGVGELLVIYLILRRFDINMAIAAAVVVSAISVWVAINYFHNDVNWHVALFAGPGAVLGGIFAKTLATRLSAKKLKLFFAFWLLLSGAAGLI